MNKRKENRVMREAGVECWEDVSTTEQFRSVIACLCKLKTEEAAHVLSQIQEIRAVSDSYFDEMCFTVVNHEPLIMFEIEDAREYINELIDAPDTDFKKLAEAYKEFFEWTEEEISVFMQIGESSALVSVADAINAIRNDGDNAETDEKISMIYEGNLSGMGLSGEQTNQAAEIEMAIEAVLEQAGLEGKKSRFNSRLN